jgi:peptidoglycan hydrolase CwlO-like protein
MSSSYNPAEETINSILTGLLPVLIVGLFNGFEDGKRMKLSVINIFDDFVIFASIVIYPIITAIDWYKYYSSYYKKTVIAYYTVIAILGIISYIRFLRVQYINEIKENENNKNVSLNEEEKEIDERGNDETSINMDDENVNNKHEENDEKINGRVIYKIIKKLFKKSTGEIFKGEMLACYFIFVLTFSSYIGYDAFISGDLDAPNLSLNNVTFSTENFNNAKNNVNKAFSHMSSYCIENFGVNKCNNLRLTNMIIYFSGIVFYGLHGFYITILRIHKLRKGNLGRYLGEFKHIIDHFKTIFKFFKHINIVLLIVYPAIVSGYLISTDPITTKIAFGICTLAFTRLVDHFNEKPDKINTLISIYLNGEENSKDKEQIDKLTEEIEKLTKKINDQTNVINNLREEIKENKLNRAET